METKEYNERAEGLYEKSVKAGKRTYFFDVKKTKKEELYITVTESKRKFNTSQGKFFYEKHKIFLYKEDFHKFSEGLKDIIAYVEANQKDNIDEEVSHSSLPESEPEIDEKYTGKDIRFEDFD